MILTVFRARANPDPAAALAHEALALEMMALAAAMPGFVSAKPYTGEDGEQLAIIEFTDAAALEAWATHPRHMAAKQLGREKFLDEYRIQVCEVIRTLSKPPA